MLPAVGREIQPAILLPLAVAVIFPGVLVVVIEISKLPPFGKVTSEPAIAILVVVGCGGWYGRVITPLPVCPPRLKVEPVT